MYRDMNSDDWRDILENAKQNRPELLPSLMALMSAHGPANVLPSNSSQSHDQDASKDPPSEPKPLRTSNRMKEDAPSQSDDSDEASQKSRSSDDAHNTETYILSCFTLTFLYFLRLNNFCLF